MKIVFQVLVVILLSACKNNNQSSSAVTEDKPEVKKETPVPIPEKAVPDKNSETSSPTVKDSSKSRLVVFFYSIGEGAEYKMITGFEDSIGRFSEKVGKTIDYKKTAWGREGETDFCLSLNELTASEQEEFISSTKALLKKAKWVNIYENFACPERGHR